MKYFVYTCKQCKRIFEVYESMNDTDLKRCPTCNSKAQRKIFAPQVIMKEKPGGLSIIDGRRASKD